jgi:hypothetical protein
VPSPKVIFFTCGRPPIDTSNTPQNYTSLTDAIVYDQFGQGYREIRKFRRDFLSLLVKVKAAYPAARLADDARGLTLEASPPPVTKQLVQVIHKAAAETTGSIADSN